MSSDKCEMKGFVFDRNKIVNEKWSRLEKRIIEGGSNFTFSILDNKIMKCDIRKFLENKEQREVLYGRTWCRQHYYYRSSNGKYYEYAYKEGMIQSCFEISEKAIEYIISDIGVPDSDNLALLKDRQKMYGLHYFDQSDLNSSVSQLSALGQKIVKRNQRQVLVNPETFNFDRLAETLIELNRFLLSIQ